MVDIALQNRRFKPGQVQFTVSSKQTPYIQHILQEIAKTHNVPLQQVEKRFDDDMAKSEKKAQLSPLLYETIHKNAAESVAFNLLMESDHQPEGVAKFSPRVFNKLVNTIAAEHDEFWPLRGFIDKRRLTPIYEFVENDPNDHSKGAITTAAAYPSGKFVFNVPFMQRLMDFAHIKQIQPKGRKYAANGGSIPNEYAYIEFVIMHELMHYSHDDFYYQKIIPNAQGNIINWVGDFRTNYLLVKSGYEQLPMGLFNDKINYDNQRTYTEMYDLVKKEFDRLRKDQQQQMSDALDDQSDDHQPGQNEGQQSSPREASIEDINKGDKAIEEQVKAASDKTAEEAANSKKAQGDPKNGKGDGPGSGGNNGRNDLDYSKIQPRFNWKALLAKFVSSAKPKMEETYMKPSRRAVAGLFTARQVGAAAIKPGDRVGDQTDAKLGFCIDSSGSMSNAINTIMANAANLMKNDMFRNSEVAVAKFSSSHELYKVNMNKKLAGKVANFTDKVQLTLPIADVLNVHYGAGTSFDAELTGKLAAAMAQKWNIIIVSDTDILSGQNFTNLMSLIKKYPLQTFVVFDSRDTYVRFRTQAGMATANITHF